MEMAEDFDELTQSSDEATDYIDSPISGHRHASLLIKQLDPITSGITPLSLASLTTLTLPPESVL